MANPVNVNSLFINCGFILIHYFCFDKFIHTCYYFYIIFY